MSHEWTWRGWEGMWVCDLTILTRFSFLSFCWFCLILNIVCETDGYSFQRCWNRVSICWKYFPLLIICLMKIFLPCDSDLVLLYACMIFPVWYIFYSQLNFSNQFLLERYFCFWLQTNESLHSSFKPVLVMFVSWMESQWRTWVAVNLREMEATDKINRRKTERKKIN